MDNASSQNLEGTDNLSNRVRTTSKRSQYFRSATHFVGEYKNKPTERQYLCDVRNHENSGVCILHQDQISKS